MDPLLQSCLQLIASFEGFRSAPYQNPGDRPTIGFGTTFYKDGTAVTLQDPSLSKDDAEDLLSYFVQKCLSHVQALVTVLITDDQATALTSFEYNTGALKGSHLLMHLNAGDDQAAADQFDLWVHAGGKVNQDLLFRRAKEKELFLTGLS